MGQKLFACNHRHIEISSITKLAWDLLVLKLKLPVEFDFGEKGMKLTRV